MLRFSAGFLLLALLALGGVSQASSRSMRLKSAKPIQLFHPQPSPKGTILMFHGFSAGPTQWSAEARARFKQGYDVIVAALPGHGFVDEHGRQDVSRLPTASQGDRYAKFARAMFERARSRSGKVHVIGFSVGGTHALEVALANLEVMDKTGRPVVRSMVAINPYLSPTPTKLAGMSIDQDAAVRVADKMSFGLVRKMLPKRDYVFKAAIEKQRAGELDVGFTQVNYGHLFAIGRFGDSVEARARELQKRGARLGRPAYVIVTDEDPTADPKVGLRVASEIGAQHMVLRSKEHNPFALRLTMSSADLSQRLAVHKAISRALVEAE